MKNHKNAESLIWIVIAVFILWIALLWIMNILVFNRDITENYSKEINSYVLQWNSENIMKKLDISQVNNGDTFYIYKNTATKEFEVLTWSSNESYKYVDMMWNNVVPADNIWKTYIREFVKDIDILKHTIQPYEVSNLVFHFDATNIDWFSTSTGTVSNWNDLSINNFDWFTLTAAYEPTYKPEVINWLPSVWFDWLNDILVIADDVLINMRTYSQKSIALVFKTWFDITSFQNIYEQGGYNRWYSIQIDDWHIYAWIWNDVERALVDHFKIVDLWEIVPDSTYFIMMIQNSNYWVLSDNNLQVYLNWELIDTLYNVDIQELHANDTGIWAVNDETLRLSTKTQISLWWYYLKEWSIWELVSWNHGLSKDQINWIKQYFLQKWLDWKENVYYNTVITNVKKLND